VFILDWIVGILGVPVAILALCGIFTALREAFYPKEPPRHGHADEGPDRPRS
jgi:hypothetical protein